VRNQQFLAKTNWDSDFLVSNLKLNFVKVLVNLDNAKFCFDALSTAYYKYKLDIIQQFML